MQLTAGTEEAITKLGQYGYSRKEAICLLDDAATNGGSSIDATDSDGDECSVNIFADGEISISY